MIKANTIISNNYQNDIPYLPLEQVCTIKRGIRVTRDQLSEKEGYPVYQNSLTPLGFYPDYNFPKNTTFIIAAGAAGKIGHSESNFWAADDCYCLICKDCLTSKFLYHFLLSKQEFLASKVRKASIPRLSKSDILKLNIPIPPIEIQNKISETLDHFSNLTRELQGELEMEIKSRQLQFEYLRNKVLCFNNLECTGGGKIE